MTLASTRWSRAAPDTDAAFIAAAIAWAEGTELELLAYIWHGYDRLIATAVTLDTRDLERSITQQLEIMIRDEMSGDEPYYIQHSPFERETMQAPPAQPPAYDLAFVFRADPRIMWPMEAKVLQTPNTLAEYLRDIRDEFLLCRYSPFSPSGAMLGYLLTGNETAALANIEKQLGAPLKPLAQFKGRSCAVSTHIRVVPSGRAYPPHFSCHHMILPFQGLRRNSGTKI